MAQQKDSKRAQTTDDSKAAPVVSEQPNSWNLGRVFWGLLAVLVGSLILAGNFGWLNVNWDNLWRLWPLLIVAAGLSMLSIRGRVWRVVMLIFILLSLAAVVFLTTGQFSGDQGSTIYKTTSQKLAGTITSANVSVKSSMAQVNVTSANQDVVAVASLAGSRASGLNEQSSRDGNVQSTSLTTVINNDWWMGNVNSKLDLSLTRSLPLTLNLDIGPSETTVDLSQAMLQSLTVKAGATKLDITLGDKVDVTNVDIESGASAVVIRVPSGSGVRVKLDGGMVASHMADLQNNNGTYESTGYDSASKKIDVTGRLGLASFTIERY